MDSAGEKSAVSSGPATIAVSVLVLDDDFGASSQRRLPATPPSCCSTYAQAILVAYSSLGRRRHRPFARNTYAHTRCLPPSCPHPPTRSSPQSHPRCRLSVPRVRRCTSLRGSSPHLSSPFLHKTSSWCYSRPPSTGLTRDF